jgi:hypothetical protein
LTPHSVEADRRDDVREFNMVEKVVLSSPLTKKKTFKKDRKKKKKKKKKKRLRLRLRLRLIPERIKANKRRCNSTSNVISSSYLSHVRKSSARLRLAIFSLSFLL